MILVATPSVQFERFPFYALCMGVTSLFVLIVVLFQTGIESRKIHAICTSIASVAKEARDPFAQLENNFFFGPLLLKQGQVSGSLSHLEGEISVLGFNSRPDCHNLEAPILVGLRRSKEERKVSSGETVFLSYDDSSSLRFSEAPSSLQFRPMALDRSSVLVEVELHEEGGIEEKAQFVTQVIPVGFEKGKKEAEMIGVLRKGKYWGVDLFLQKYGGEEYRTVKDKGRIQLGSEIHFVGEGDLFEWDGTVWGRIAREKIKSSLPLAQVTAVGSSAFEVMVWDSSGFKSSKVPLSLQSGQRLESNLEEFSSLNQRTATQVTCRIGKKKMTLKKGDWLLKRGNEWSNLRKIEEIEDYLSFRIRGELFIFEGIERKGGISHVKGTLFDSMRTQAKPISLAIVSDKKGGGANLKKTKNLHY